MSFDTPRPDAARRRRLPLIALPLLALVLGTAAPAHAAESGTTNGWPAAGILLGLLLVAAAIALPVLLNRSNRKGRRTRGGGGGGGGAAAIGHDSHDADRSGGWSWDGGGWGGGGDGGGDSGGGGGGDGG
ncbi:hypothetical protein DFP74_3503 [Nocardiopsis sp. Huas11]|uniref:hypothetical protein n=1 Tax=Nocardiopsis sp. Huas11 TaxID=2183912 RepID=UPI000EAF586D|nr:hypothetical protein [Nocardiopsis sp. Huas11]RKS07818.1 hypothetical protein DFP74_3503 [Nocardiopsis sp. Huas11]